MTLKIWGNVMNGNGTDYSFKSRMKVTCLKCNYSDYAQGNMKGDIKCPRCGCGAVSISPATSAGSGKQ